MQGAERHAGTLEILKSNERLRFVYKDDVTLFMATGGGNSTSSIRQISRHRKEPDLALGWAHKYLGSSIPCSPFSRSFRPRVGTKSDLITQSTILNNSLV